MKKTYKKIFYGACLLLSIAFAALIVPSCTSNKPYGQDFDIPYPHPAISSFTPSALIGTEITINGTNLDQVTSVKIGDKSVDTVTVTDSYIIVTLPRVLPSGKITVNNYFQLSATTSNNFQPIYPGVTITGWPSVIYRGGSIKLEGENVDQIKEVTIGGQKVTVDGSSASANSITFSISSLTLSAASAVIKITGAYGEIDINSSTSASIPVKDPLADYDPLAPIVLFDFEDGVDPYVGGTKTATHGINLTSSITKGRGAKYLTVKTSAADGWTSDLGSISATNINLTGFTNATLTFLINTNQSDGYFQVEWTQGSKSGGAHMTSAVTGVSDDSYNINTGGEWQWRSFSLANYPASVGWGDWDSFDPTGTIDLLKIVYKQGNGTGDFEVNLDQIMITDGLMGRGAFVVYDFEDGVNPYSGTATASINGNGSIVNEGGDKFLTVTNAATGNWSWTGAESNNNGGSGYDIVAYKRTPYLNIWINTGANSGFVQLFVGQGTQQYVYSHPDNVFTTNGDWKLYSVKLTSDFFAVDQYHPGYIAGSTLDSKQKIDYVQIGYTTGTTPAAYEVNADDIIISDGPMF